MQESSLFSRASSLRRCCPGSAGDGWSHHPGKAGVSSLLLQGDAHTISLLSTNHSCSTLSEAVIIFVSGDKGRRETGTVCSLFQALKSFWVFGAGRRLRWGMNLNFSVVLLLELEGSISEPINFPFSSGHPERTNKKIPFF